MEDYRECQNWMSLVPDASSIKASCECCKPLLWLDSITLGHASPYLARALQAFDLPKAIHFQYCWGCGGSFFEGFVSCFKAIIKLYGLLQPIQDLSDHPEVCPGFGKGCRWLKLQIWQFITQPRSMLAIKMNQLPARVTIRLGRRMSQRAQLRPWHSQRASRIPFSMVCIKNSVREPRADSSERNFHWVELAIWLWQLV